MRNLFLVCGFVFWVTTAFADDGNKKLTYVLYESPLKEVNFRKYGAGGLIEAVQNTELDGSTLVLKMANGIDIPIPFMTPSDAKAFRNQMQGKIIDITTCWHFDDGPVNEWYVKEENCKYIISSLKYACNIFPNNLYEADKIKTEGFMEIQISRQHVWRLDVECRPAKPTSPRWQ